MSDLSDVDESQSEELLFLHLFVFGDVVARFNTLVYITAMPIKIASPLYVWFVGKYWSNSSSRFRGLRSICMESEAQVAAKQHIERSSPWATETLAHGVVGASMICQSFHRAHPRWLEQKMATDPVWFGRSGGAKIVRFKVNSKTCKHDDWMVWCAMVSWTCNLLLHKMPAWVTRPGNNIVPELHNCQHIQKRSELD